MTPEFWAALPRKIDRLRATRRQKAFKESFQGNPLGKRGPLNFKEAFKKGV